MSSRHALSSRRLDLASALFLLAAGAHAATEIWVPRQHNPGFAEAGRSFVAEVRAAPDLAAAGWTAALKNDLRSWNCTVASAVFGKIHHAKESGWLLTIAVPADTPPELLDLTVDHPASGPGTQARSLRVVKSFEENFYIVQLSDQHVVGATATQAGGNTSDNAGSTEAMKWAAPVLNLINPRFVAYTGDNETIFWEGEKGPGLEKARIHVQIYKEALTHFRVPTILCLGNHDIGWGTSETVRSWRLEYETLVGQRCQSFRMGSFYVLNNEWTINGELPYLAWAKSDYLAAYNDTSVKYRLLLQHYYDRPYEPRFIPIPDDKPCSLALGGHTHGTGKLPSSPYPYLLVGTAQDRQRAAFFSFEKTGTGWTCPQVATHGESSNVFRLVGDWGAPKVSIAYSAANDGTQIGNTATIVNNLPATFYSGRVRFLVPRGTYTVTGGSVEATYDYASGSRTAVLVKVNIAKNATVKVTIARESAPTPPVPSAPGNLKAQAASTSQINLAWTDNAGDETGFKIERKTGSGGTWTQIATVGANAASYSDTGLASNTLYVYRVRACNGAGDSGYSNEASATTGNRPPTVTLTAPASGASFTASASIALTATASDPDGSVMKVEFFSGATKLGEDTTSPYGLIWSNPAVGSHSLVAKATDNSGATATSSAVSITVHPAAVVGNGNGLLGEYFDDPFFGVPRTARTDATVNFDWGTGSPSANIAADTFTARWSGQIQAQYTETYTITTLSDDGVRLWIGGKEIVNNWTDHGPTEDSGTIAMVAGQKYSVWMEYYEHAGGATVRLLWSSPSTAKQVVPQSQLYSDPLRTPENPSGTGSGLDFAYYHGTWDLLPDFAALTPVKTGTVSDFNLGSRTQNDHFAFRFTGFVDVPYDGSYSFFTSSDDGSRLSIGSTLVVDNDGLHALQERAGTIGLRAGKHALTVLFFERTGSEGLSVSWSGPGIGKQLVPVGRLYRVLPANGDGLLATYFDTENLTGTTATRVDKTIDFDWGLSAPAAGFGVDTYSARWTGYVVPPASGSYTFIARTDDGVRLWVNGQAVIDFWQLRSVAESSGTIALNAGQRYSIRMEYYNGPGHGVAQLYWTGPGLSRQIVPQKHLYSK